MRHIPVLLAFVIVAWSQAPKPGVIVGGGGGTGGGGASQTADLTDFAATVSGSVATIGATCSTAKPCRARVGDTVVTLTSAATVTLSGSTATSTLYVYITSAGIVAGHNAAWTATCNGNCFVTTGVSAFPFQTIPLYALTATSNAFDSVTAAMDRRAFTSVSSLVAGPSGNIQIASDGLGNTQVEFVGSTSGVDCTDPATLCLFDRFVPVTNAGSSAVLSWRQHDGGASFSNYLNRSGTEGAHYQVRAGNTAGNWAAISLSTDGEAIGTLSPLTTTNDTAIFRFRVANSLSQIMMRVGLIGQPTSGNPAEFIGIRYNNNSGSGGCTSGSDTVLTYVTTTGSTVTASTTNAVTPATDTYYTVRIRRTASGIGFSTSTGTASSWSTETVITTNIPTQGLSPFFSVRTCEAVVKDIYPAFFSMKMAVGY